MTDDTMALRTLRSRYLSRETIAPMSDKPRGGLPA